MMVNDSFSVSSFAKNGLKPKCQMVKMTKVVAKILQDILQFILFISW